MALSTPFFSAFGPLLFGRRRLSEVDKLLGQTSTFRSLSQYQEAFGEFIPPALLARQKSGVNSRTRIFTSLIIFWAFLAQVLERGSSGRDALRRLIAWSRQEHPHAPAPSPDTGGYCQARARLQTQTIEQIGTHLAERLQRQVPASELWQGRRVKIVDGTTASMPDTAENQEAWPQPRSQKPGCGFPLVKLVGLFELASGALTHLTEGHHRVHERVLARGLWRHLEPGEVLLGDRGFCSYQDLCEIAQRGADAVMRFHGARKLDLAKAERLGPHDWRLTWQKPAQCPKGGLPETWAALPETLTVRLVRYRVETPGFRSEEVTLVTTLLDPVAFPAPALAELYFRRWSVELHFREIKTLLGLDVLRCLTPEMVRKEIALQRVAYNLVRVLMQRAALVHQVSLRRLSFKGTLDSLATFADAIHSLSGKPRRQQALLEDLLLTLAQDLLPVRPGRVEPRARKRRAKNYHLLTKPRRQMHVPNHRHRPRKSSQNDAN
jgi:hypothetical protein